MGKKKVLKRIFMVAITALLLAAVEFIGAGAYIDKYASRYMVDVESAPVADAVMVLGALVYSDGTPSPVLEDRLLYALALYQKGKAKKIVVSGDHGTKQYDEVNAMKDYLMQKGVPREDIFMDHAGFDTYDSMYRAKSVFKVKTLLISTQQFHISRSVYIARRLGIQAYGYPCPDKEIYNMEALRFRESLAKIKAFLDIEIFKSKPRFEGEAIPIWSDGILTDG